MAKKHRDPNKVIQDLKKENWQKEHMIDAMRYILHDVQIINDLLVEDARKRKETECGHIVIEGSRTSAAYQDLVGILLANDYAVELTPRDDHRKLEVIIRKGQVN